MADNPLPYAEDLFPASTKPDADELFPLGKDVDRQAAGRGEISDSPLQDLIFGDESHNPVAKVLNGFGQGAQDGWGSDSLGISQEHLDQFKKAQINVDDYFQKRGAIAKAANVALIRPAATTLVTYTRLGAELADLIMQRVPATLIGAAAGAVSAISPRAGKAVDYYLQQSMDPGAAMTVEGIPYAGPLLGAGIEGAQLALRGPLGMVERARQLRLIGRGERGAADTAPIEAPKAEVLPKPAATTPPPPPGAPAPSPLSEAPPAAPATPENIHAAVRQEAPELMAHYDELVEEKTALEEFMTHSAEHGEAAQLNAEMRLTALNTELDTLSPQIGQLYKRLATAAPPPAEPTPEAGPQFRTMAEMLAARAEEGVERPPLPEPVEAPPRSPEEQRNFIAGDVASKLVAAGRPAEEAQAAGALVAERYMTRAARFEGKLGTGEDLYRRESAEIRGSAPATPAAPAAAEAPETRAEVPGSALPEPLPEQIDAGHVKRFLDAVSDETMSAALAKRKANGIAPALENRDQVFAQLMDELKTIRERPTTEALMDTPERIQRQNEAVDLLDRQSGYAKAPTEPVPRKTERRVDIVLGPPAAGKSTYLAPLLKEHGSLLLDADEAKQLIPEFEGGLGAGAVHVESARIAENLLASRAIERGDNIVQPLIGKNLNKISQLIDAYKGAGYNVNLHYVDLPIEKAMSRAMSRYVETGRLLDPGYIASIDHMPGKTYDALKGKADGYRRVSTDVPFGAPPRVIEDSNVPGAGLGVGELGRGPEGVQAEAQGLTEHRPIPSEIVNGIHTFNPNELLVDADRFQFKTGGDEFGVTDRLKGVKKWDPIKAGMVLAWEDRNGQRYLVDGHQRLGLAKRIAAEDPSQHPILNGYLLREADGVSDVEARAIAAAKNIAEGTGTAVDAAKVLRDRPDLLDTLPPRSELVRQARNLVNLEPDAFRMVVNDLVPANQAAIVGALAPQDRAIQMGLLDLLAKTEPENLTQAESIVRQGLEAGTTKEVQHTLFGEEEVAKNLYFERAKVLDRALQQIKRDRTIFSTLVKERELIEQTGSQLAHDVNERRANADAQAVQILQTLANRTGPIGDALNTAARQAKHDGKYAPAVRSFIEAVRRQAESGDLARLADGEARRLSDVGTEGGPSAVDRIPAERAPITEPEQVLFQRAIRGRDLIAEREAEGQMAFPGAERLTPAQMAARRAAAPLRPRVAQEAPTGLFGEAARQVELALPPAAEAPTLPIEAPHGPVDTALRERAPGVPGEQSAGDISGPSPIRRPEQLPLFGGGGGVGYVRPPDVGGEAGGAEAAVPRPGEGVTSPPPRSGGVNTPRRNQPAIKRTVKETEDRIAERSRSNYRITPEDHIGEGGPKEKVAANLEAIRTLKAIEDEGRGPTAEEKAKLVKYTGWGAFAQQIFLEKNPAWTAERKSLRSLLSDQEWDSARASTPNAHYTSPEVIQGIWRALDHLGFKGGLALEPSAGIGHFIGLVPDGVAPKTAWTAVELDSISARIAKALYQGAEVNEGGFEDLKRPANYYDLAISNVPFGDYNIREKQYGAFPIHDFFFVKSLDKVRPGGVVSFITSRYTMDRVDPSIRKLLAQSADLVGAIRLPGGREGAFAANAGTEVTTDLIFLRKKVPGEAAFPGNDWADLKEIQTPEGPAKINQYFADHPDKMLGEMRLQGTQYRANEPALIGTAENLGARIAEAARSMPAAFTEKSTVPDFILSSDVPGDVKDSGYFIKDGAIYQRRAGVGHVTEISGEDAERVTKLIGMRDLVNNVMGAQLTGADAEPIRAQLREAYDAFVAAHGPINREVRTVTSRIGADGEPIVITRMPNFKAFRDDPDSRKVAAIENYDRDTDTGTRAAIQERDVIDAPKQRQINSPADALAASLDDRGAVDLDHIGQALGLETYDDVTHALGDLIYHNPDGRAWETADKYLSGDVVKKLEEARTLAASDPAYLRNVAALEKVQPLPLRSHDITASFGAPWIPPEDYKAFFESLGASNARVTLVPITKDWRVDFRGASRDSEAKYATNRVRLDEIAESAMNNRQITVRDKDEDGNYHVNQKETDEARVKSELLKEAFTGNQEAGLDGWVWSEPERTERLEAIYNRTFNNLVSRKFDGSHQTLPGLNPDFATRQHRLDAVWRMVQNGNTLLAHVVGSGKTVTMISGGMEMKRLGLINKPAYVVPNHMLEQFSREFIQAYPNAKILVAEREEMSADKRKAFIAKAAANDWDGIVITHDAFGRINMAKEFRQDFIHQQMEELARVMDAQVEEEGKNGPTVKALEKAKKRFQTKLAKLMAEERKDEGVSFEESGIDHLFVDEAHLFKNLNFVTRMQRVKGLAQGDAQRAEDLFLKIRYLEQKRPGRSAVFATGTPVSNTMAELWTMMRYLELDKLKERGLDTFDAWASTFGQIKTNTELSADGRTFKDVASFSKFVNIPELISLYAEVADTKTADMLNLPRPEVRTRSGAPGIEIVQAEPSAAEEKFIDGLVSLAESIKGKKPGPGVNMLSIATAGRKVATDGRLIGNTETDREVLGGRDIGRLDYNPNGKVALAVGNIARISREGDADDGPGKVQMVFLDMGTPKPKGKVKRPAITEETGDEGMDPAEVEGQAFDLYSEIKGRLIDEGIPANEIAFIHDAPTDEKKARLFDKVRRGEVRVLIGSTGKMGVGTNVQDRLIAMHHLDAPWKPAEVEQRDGRIVRQGNLNPNVQIYRYVTKRSFDAFMWQKLDTKSKFIGQVLSGTKGSRVAEDIDNPLPEAAEMKAAASGDPRILEHADLDRQVRQLTQQRRVFEQTKDRATWELKTAKSRVGQYEGSLPNARIDAAKVADLSGDKFAVTLNGATVTDRFQAGKAIVDRVTQLDPRNFYTPKVVDIGQMSGFDMKMVVRGTWTSEGPYLKAEFRLDGSNQYTSPNDAAINAETNPIGLMTRYTNLLHQIATNPDRLTRELSNEQMNVSKLERTLAEPWAKEAEYKTALQKLDALTKELKAPKNPDVAKAEGDAKIEAEEKEYAQGVLQIHTPEFQQWFGDSKVVDDLGQPLRAYHGTAADFEAFNTRVQRAPGRSLKWLGDLGSWFTAPSKFGGNYDEGNAEYVAGSFTERGPYGYKEGARIIPAYLSVKKPAEFEGWDDLREAVAEAGGPQELRADLEKAGNDGIVIRNSETDGSVDRDDWIVFKPEQVKSAFNRGTFDPNDPRFLYQQMQGKVRIARGKRPIITLAKTANVSTFIHESGHVFLEELMRDAAHPEAPALLRDDARTTLNWLGIKDATEIQTRHHEKFARGFEQYLREGVAPSAQLGHVFARFKAWLLRIYQTLSGLGTEITPEIRGVFDRLLAETPQRTIVTPELAKRPTLQDIHESDVALTEPHHAEAAADAVVAETQRESAALPPDVVNEHNRGAAQTGTSAAELAPLREPEPPPQPVGEGGIVGPQAGAELGVGSEPLPESPGLRVGKGEAGKLEPQAIGPHVDLDSIPDKVSDKVGNIRLENLNTPADVNAAIRALYNENKERLDAATGGRISDQSVMDLADAMGVNPSIVANNIDRLRNLSLEDNVPLAARIWLLRDVFTRLATEVSKAMQGTDVEAYAAARQRFLMAHETLVGVTAEVGRGLRAFRSMRGQVAEAMGLAAKLKEDTGKTLFQLRQEMALGRAAETPAQVARMIGDAERSTYQKVKSGVISYVVNNLISGPITHLAYSIGNTVTELFKTVVEVPAAALAGRVLQATGQIAAADRITAGEVMPRLYGMVAGARDGVTPAYKALRTGVSVMRGDPSGIDLFSNDMAYRPQAIPGQVGYVLETPSRAVAAIHTMHYGMNFESEISAMAYRDALAKGFEPGSVAFNAHVGEFRQNPPAWAIEAGHKEALDMVLMRKPPYGGLQNWIEQVTNKYLLAKIIAPFVRIGGNILRGSFIERTPLGVADQTVRDNLLGRNGAAAQQMQYGKIIVGTGLATTVIGLTAEGIMTGGGPSDPKQREVLEMTGWKPYSIKIGDEYIPYRKFLGFLGPLVAGAADVYEVGHTLSEKGLTDAAAALSFGFAEVVADETWMRGITATIDAARHWDRDGGKYLRNMSMEFLPFSIGLRQIASLTDPTWRSVRSEMDALRAHIPGLSQGLFPVRDLWGNPQRGGVMMAPSPAVHDAATEALQAAEYYPARMPRKIRGVELTDQEYDDLTRIAGRDAHMHINAMVSNPGFALLPKDLRHEQLQKAMEASREMARTTILMRPGPLATAIRTKETAQRAAFH